MDVLEAIEQRLSCRAFLDKPVPKELVHRVFEAARWAASGVNHQPWQAIVLDKASMDAIGDAFIDARENQVAENPDYDYYPTEWVEPYKARRKACGAALYGALEIDYQDKAARKAQWYKNYRFFGAPVGIVFCIDDHLCKGSWMDFGIFLQSVMLAARGLGLETCPQAALSEYPDLIRKQLKLDDSKLIVCGMAMGYGDMNNPVNQYRTQREPVDEFVTWVDERN